MNNIFFSENRAVYEIMCKICYRAEEATDGNKTRRFLFACWIMKVTDTHSGYIILVAFPRQKMFIRTRLNITLYVHAFLFNIKLDGAWQSVGLQWLIINKNLFL